MGRYDAITDMTGTMSPLEVNQENISGLIDELNRNADQLDGLTNSLAIIGRGSSLGTWNGTGGINAGLTLIITHGLPEAPIFMGFYTRSDKSGVFTVPYWDFDNSGNLLSRAYALSTVNNIIFNFAMVSNGSPINITFSWYAIQQPAIVPTGS